MQIKGILFDFDGVLANTMNDLFLAWKKAFQNYNVEIKAAEYGYHFANPASASAAFSSS